jgi:hypothetical protein
MTEAQQAVRIQAWLTQEGKACPRLDRGIANMHERLASVSEFVKYLSQPIARRANIEDDCKGKFWESRFKCQRLLDEAAVLSAMVYVDLNPVRAAMAQDLEDSDYTVADPQDLARSAVWWPRRRSARSHWRCCRRRRAPRSGSLRGRIPGGKPGGFGTVRSEAVEGASWCGPLAGRFVGAYPNSGAGSYVTCPLSDRTAWQ